MQKHNGMRSLNRARTSTGWSWEQAAAAAAVAPVGLTLQCPAGHLLPTKASCVAGNR